MRARKSYYETIVDLLLGTHDELRDSEIDNVTLKDQPSETETNFLVEFKDKTK